MSVERMVSRQLDFVRGLSVCLIVLSGLVLLGWLLDVRWLTTFYSSADAASMKPTTALTFTLFAVAMLLETNSLVKLALGFISSVLIVALANIIVNLQGAFLAQYSDYTMSLATSIEFALIAITFLISQRTRKIYFLVGGVFLMISIYVATLGLYGYSIDYHVLYSLTLFSSFSLPTAIAFVLLLFALTLLFYDQGFIGIFYRDSLGGFMARRLLALAFFLPLIIGWLVLLAIQAEFISYELGILFVVTTLSIVITLVGLQVSLLVHRVDGERQHVLDELQKLNHRLTASEVRLKENNRRLRKLNEYMDGYIHTVAHTLRGKVVNIKALTQAKKGKIDIPPVLIDRKIDISVDMLDDHLRSLVKLLELQSEKLEQPKVVHFEEIWKEVANEYKQPIGKCEPSISSNFAQAEKICYSEKYLKTILKNLLDNSLAYCDPDRPLIIEVSTERQGKLTLLRFSDNGLGIRSETGQHRAFDAFRRLTTVGKGKGMGLYAVKVIVEKNGGRAAIDSHYNQGTEVQVYLKAYPSKAMSDLIISDAQ